MIAQRLLCLQVKAAMQPLYDILTRFVPNLSSLTPIHPIFVTVSIKCYFCTPLTGFHQCMHAIDFCHRWLPQRVLPMFVVAISQISTTLCLDLRYPRCLLYDVV
jgi:hypothetical protein